MTAAEFELLDADEAEAFLTWRFRTLSAAGYAPEQALRLAVAPTENIRAARLLLQHGVRAATAWEVRL